MKEGERQQGERGGERAGRTQEEVVGVGTHPPDLEQLEEVPELSVDVSAYLNWIGGVSLPLLRQEQLSRAHSHGRVDPLNVRLLNENLPRLEA